MVTADGKDGPHEGHEAVRDASRPAFSDDGHAHVKAALTANVAQAGDILLFVVILGVALVVGFAFLSVDAVVGRLRKRSFGSRGRTVDGASAPRPRAG